MVKWTVINRWIAWLAPLLGATAVGAAGVPEIAGIFPGFAMEGPQLIMGEQFTPGTAEVWTWQPPADPASIRAGAANYATLSAALPPTPPEGAMKLNLWDAEAQVLVVPLTAGILWIRNGNGWSKPCVGLAPRPFWLTRDTAVPGDRVAIFGQGLRKEQGDCQVVLLAGGKVVVADPAEDPRGGGQVQDPYLVVFRVPAGMPPGPAEVLVNNGTAGQFGWVKAGRLAIGAEGERAVRIVNVTACGADGRDDDDDRAAVVKAMAGAEPGDGLVVYFPPGRYRVDETISVPPGVTLRGAARENTIIEGVAAPARQGGQPAVLVELKDRSGLESLTFRGRVGKGIRRDRAPLIAIGGMADGQAASDVRIIDCLVQAAAPGGHAALAEYESAIVAGTCRQVRIVGNILWGSLGILDGRQVEIAHNEVRQAQRHGVAFEFQGEESLVDANFFVDMPGRLRLFPWGRNYFRFNELHDYYQGAWRAGSDGGMALADPDESVAILPVDGALHGATATTLTAADGILTKDAYAGATVLITTGRGFGQYRRITGNGERDITISEPWRVIPDATSRFHVSRLYVENVFYGNVNVGLGAAITWRQAVGCVVDRHYCPFANSSELSAIGADDTRIGLPRKPEAGTRLWCNLFQNCRLEGGFMDPLNTGSSGMAFGNLYLRNRFQRLHRPTAYQGTNPPPMAALAIGLDEGHATGATSPPFSHTVIADNIFAQMPEGVGIGKGATKTMVVGNRFWQVPQPYVDGGAKSLIRDNVAARTPDMGARRPGQAEE